MNDNPLSKILDAIHRVTGSEAKRNGKGWTACCPAHDDRNPSLSITEREDGGVLLRCHAGCTFKNIMTSLGLREADAMPDDPARSTPRKVTARTAPKTYPTASAAITSLERSLGKRSAEWTYHDRHGKPVGVVVRWETQEGKTIRPVSSYGTTWRIGAMPEPRPLYRLPELADAQRVYYCEGEKAAEAIRALGLTATTSAGGCKAARKTDWTPLSGKECIVLPDNDEPGQHGAEDVTRRLDKYPATTVKILNLPDLPPRGDAVEFVAARRAAGLDDDSIRAEIELLADAAEPVRIDTPGKQPALPPARYVPFPVDVLPCTVARFCQETAAALGCDVAYVALPVLCVVAAAIGLTRAIGLNPIWQEYAIIWAALVARSGSLKTPAAKKAVRPLLDAQIEALRAYREAAENHERERAEYDRAFTAWKNGKGDHPPEKPETPTADRFIVSDITVEALAPILETNPRGLLAHRDELAGWIRSFDAYKKGRGADVAAWLPMWSAEYLSVDRKTTETIHVEKAAVSVYGTIQPGALARTLTPEYFENGLAARLLLAQPPELVERWSGLAPAQSTLRDYNDLIARLLALTHIVGERGPEPAILPLTAEALAVWEPWFNDIAQRRADANTDAEAAVLAKARGYGARFALIFALAENPDAVDVSADAVRWGTTLADWFAAESSRVCGLMDESDEDRAARTLVDWIERNGRGCTVRELTHRLRQYKGQTEAARKALQVLVNAGRGRWTHPAPGATGGRPPKRFELVAETPERPGTNAGNRSEDPADTGGTVPETPAETPENGAFGYGGAGDSLQDPHAPDAPDVGELPGCPDGEGPPGDVGADDDDTGEL